MFNCIKGINLGGWLSQCVYETKHYDSFIKESDFARVKSMGFDHVRIPIDYQLIEREDGSLIEENFKYIDRAIEWAKKNDLYMILDLHKTYGYSFDSDINNSSSFFCNEAKQERFLHLWDVLAKRYSKFKEFLSFELLNEIVESSVTEKWNKLLVKAISTIRKYSKDIYILIGGVCYNSVSSVDTLPVLLDNIVYNFHCYDPISFTHQGAYWVKNMPSDFRLKYPITIEELLELKESLPKENAVIFDMFDKEAMKENFFETIFSKAIAFAEKNNLQLYCGEYGVINLADPSDAINWYKDINASFEKHHIGRALWSYKEMDFGITDDHYKNDLYELLKYV